MLYGLQGPHGPQMRATDIGIDLIFPSKPTLWLELSTTLTVPLNRVKTPESVSSV